MRRPPLFRWRRMRPPASRDCGDRNSSSQSSDESFDRDVHSVEFARLLNLSDGVFAIALTLLVLSLEIPSGLSTGNLTRELLDISPMLVAFLISVGIIALFWFSHHELFAEVQRIDQSLMWQNFGYLSLVVIIPFVQRLQGDYPFEPISYVLFAGVLALLNFLDLVMHRHVHTRSLLTQPWSPERYRTEILRGIVLTTGFLMSIPLSYVMVNLVVIMWVALIPIDRYVKSRGLAKAEA